MLDLSTPVLELILRPAVVYAFLFIGFRWIGKKHIGDLAPFVAMKVFERKHWESSGC